MPHVHHQSQSRDCDGLYDRSHDDFRNTELDEQDLVEKVVADILPALRGDAQEFLKYEGIQIKVQINDYEPEGQDAERVVKIEAFWYTSEGFEHHQAQVCSRQICEPEPPRFRDHTAEAAGY